jgi:O-methyltransferase
MGSELALLNKQKVGINDFYSSKRDHSKRQELHNYLIEKENLGDSEIVFIEFGVFDGNSFKFWTTKNKHPQSKFYGFDTFEGLPENWGAFKAGDMNSSIPIIDGETRHEFFKGMFQDTLYGFLEMKKGELFKRKVIHFDADLFSSTLFGLTNLDRYLNSGDIIIFDEYNVPNHEYLAFSAYKQAFYRKFEFLGAVNNFYQVAFKLQ